MLTTRQIQTALATAGVYSGKVDGVTGARTVQALRAFQTRQGLPVTGHCCPVTEHQLSFLSKGKSHA